MRLKSRAMAGVSSASFLLTWPFLFLVSVLIFSFLSCEGTSFHQSSPATSFPDAPAYNGHEQKSTLQKNGSAVNITIRGPGSVVPGEEVVLRANLTITDQSTYQTAAWLQIAGTTITQFNSEGLVLSLTVPSESELKAALLENLQNPPVYVPGQADQGIFQNGLQERFHIVGIDPFSCNNTKILGVTLTVLTSSGIYSAQFFFEVRMPWVPTSGLSNVAIHVPLLLQSKMQDSYSWDLEVPAGSQSFLFDASTGNPYFIPDMKGQYTLRIFDCALNQEIELSIECGKWLGAITGLNNAGNPEAEDCRICHIPDTENDPFTAWAGTGHAHIFSDVLNSGLSYDTSCMTCHTVGFDPLAINQGFDDSANYENFLESGLRESGNSDNWKTMLDNFPDVARLANVQCENCHGPQDSDSHASSEGLFQNSRVSFSATVCAICHGATERYNHYQQWQNSRHGNFFLAEWGSSSPSCARCHTAQGFLTWLPQLLSGNAGQLVDPDPQTPANEAIFWTKDTVQPQTCVTCHDPHQTGTKAGIDNDVVLRVSGNTPPLPGGFTGTNLGNGAVCLICHESHQGTVNDSAVDDEFFEGTRAPHFPTQGDVFLGRNAFFVDEGPQSKHANLEDSCVLCHLIPEQAEGSALPQRHMDHTFIASPDRCNDCHPPGFAAALQSEILPALSALKDLTRQACEQLINDALIEGELLLITVQLPDYSWQNNVTLNQGTIVIVEELYTAHKRLFVKIREQNSDIMYAAQLQHIMQGGLKIFSSTERGIRILKAGWNVILLQNDESGGLHNLEFVRKVIAKTEKALLKN